MTTDQPPTNPLTGPAAAVAEATQRRHAADLAAADAYDAWVAAIRRARAAGTAREVVARYAGGITPSRVDQIVRDATPGNGRQVQP